MSDKELFGISEQLESSHESDHVADPGNMVGNSISRQAAIDALDKRFDSIPMEQTTEILQLRRDLRNLPSAQPNLSEAYSKAVFTWLMDYQIRTVELKGRYTPYEVLSWVINDWRRENG